MTKNESLAMSLKVYVEASWRLDKTLSTLRLVFKEIKDVDSFK